MLPPPSEIKIISDTNEVKTQKRFEKQGYKVRKIDDVPGVRCPDFLVSDKEDKPLFLSEVKTILSASPGDNGAHLSMLDDTVVGNTGGPFTYNSFPKIEDVLADAASQYRDAVGNINQYALLPYVVVLYPDFFVADLSLMPADIFGLTEISAVVQLERNAERESVARRLDLETLRKLIRGLVKIKLGAETLQWRALRNKQAAHWIKKEYLEPCILL